MLVVVLASLSAGIGAVGFGGRLPRRRCSPCRVDVLGGLGAGDLRGRLPVMPDAPRRGSSLGQLLRTIGFAATPGLISRSRVHAGPHRAGVHRVVDLDAGGDDRRRAPRPRLRAAPASCRWPSACFGWAAGRSDRIARRRWASCLPCPTRQPRPRCTSFVSARTPSRREPSNRNRRQTRQAVESYPA